MSRPSESDEAFFSDKFYQSLVWNNYLFDIAKLYDIIAIFGRSNPETVRSIVANVFANDKRYV